jgi:aspartyl-tRNA(Asn)/glutamyl-tRNA(Gln) amidotransferase subunit A
VKGLRVGIPREFLTDAVQPDVRAAVVRAFAWLAAEGAVCGECALPSVDSWIPAYYIVSSAEASSNLARFDGVRYGHRAAEYDTIASMYSRSRSEGFGSEVKRRILLGTFVLSAGYHDAYYGSAQKARAHIRSGFDGVFADHDVLLGPVAPQTAFTLGEKSGDPLQMYLQDICTVGASLAGLPAMSVPAGFDAAGLPIGLHLTGPAFSEETLFAAAGCIERAAACRSRRPDLGAAVAAGKGG